MKKKVEKKVTGEPVKTNRAVPKTNLTPAELALFQRIRGEQDDWKSIRESDIEDASLAQDPFKLPAEARALRDAKQFVFRWIERTPERLDEVRSASVPHRWWIVNANTMPDLEHLCDPILGCVTKLDQMLVFKPYWMWVKRQEVMEELNQARERAGDIKQRDGEVKGGTKFSAGMKSGDNPEPLVGEIKGGDRIEYEEPKGSEDGSFGDLIDE